MKNPAWLSNVTRSLINMSSMFDRIIALLVILCSLTWQSSSAQPLASGEFRVTLLGTGSPAPAMNRFGPGVLIQVGGKNLLIDSGRGTTQRLWQAGLKLGQVDASKSPPSKSITESCCIPRLGIESTMKAALSRFRVTRVSVKTSSSTQRVPTC